MDKRTLENIATLNSVVAKKAEELYDAILAPLAAVGIVPKIISGLRSWKAQQALYDQGRTKPGEIVTKSRPGSSWHNYGLAIDFGLYDATTAAYLDAADPKRADAGYKVVANIAVAAGWEWAGNWKSFTETPHFQFTGKLKTIAQAKERFLAVGMSVDRMLESPVDRGGVVKVIDYMAAARLSRRGEKTYVNGIALKWSEYRDGATWALKAELDNIK